MANSILLNDLTLLKKSLKKQISIGDIGYYCYDADKDTVLEGSGAILNEYKIWLQSGSLDFHRNPGFGGFTEGNMNRYKFSDDSIPTIKSDLIQLTAEKFPNIELLSVEVKRNTSDMSWRLKVAVRDKITGLISTDMFDSSESVVYSSSES